jgi:hypothetical protein
LLIPLLVLFNSPTKRIRIWKATALAAGVGVVFLLYRTWYLGGVGGYTTANGEPSIFNFSLIRTSKALFFRQWAILFFPINWSTGLGFALKAATVLMIAAVAGFLLRASPSRTRLAASLLFVIAAVLPAQHLLLIGSDLSGARVLYLPAVGLALFWGFTVDGLPANSIRIALAAGLLIFQTAALEHNLAIWREVAFRSQGICRDFGAEIARAPGPVAVRDLPATRNGVYFLKNGFPQCVGANSSQSPDRIQSSGARTFSWSDEAQNLREVF